MKVFILGTATWDRVRCISGLPFDGKDVAEFHYEQSGGGGINARLALEGIAKAYGRKVTAILCTKFGADDEKKNQAKKLVLDELTNDKGMDDKTIIDVAFEEPYFVPDNAVTIFGKNGDTGRHIVKKYNDINTPFSATSDQEIIDAIEGKTEGIEGGECDILILNSRFPKQVAVAAKTAHELNKKRPEGKKIKIILDYSESDGTKEGMEEMVKLADYILLPHEADVPRMPRSLLERVKHYADEKIESFRKERVKNGLIENSILELPKYKERKGFLVNLTNLFQKYAPWPKRPAKDIIGHVVSFFGKENVAVSDGARPVQVWADGKPHTLDLSLDTLPYFENYDEDKNPKPRQADNLGAGDARDGALGFFMGIGDDFLLALKKANRIASFSAQYPGREWIKHLPRLFEIDPIFKIGVNNSGSQPTIENA